MSTSRARRWGRLLAAGAVLLFLLLAAHPVWYPWFLGPIAGGQGVRFESYRREGYGGLRLRGVRWKSGRAGVEVRDLRVDGPLVWLWRRYGRAMAGEGATAQLEAEGWRVEVTSREPGTEERETALRSTTAALAEVERVVPEIRRWLDRAVLRGGTIDLGGALGELRVSQAEWRDGRLKAIIEPPGGVVERVALEVVAPGLQPGMVRLDAGERAGTLTMTVGRRDEGWAVRGTVEARGNRVPIEARFGAGGWWPEVARVAATNLVIPADMLGLDRYESLRGQLVWDWREGKFTLTASGTAAPTSLEPVWQPPVEFELRAGGDFESVLMEVMRLQSPWFQAELSEPTTLLRVAPWVTEPVGLRVEANLGRVPGSPVTGRLSGQVRAMPVLGAAPRVRFALVGTGVSWGEIRSRTLDVSGSLEWPQLALEWCEVELEEGGTILMSGDANLRSREVEFGRWNLRGDWARHWLPADWKVAEVQASGIVRGPVTNLAHGGRIEAKQVEIPGLRPLETSFDWEAEALKFRQFEAAASAGGSRIEAKGSAEVGWPLTSEHTLTLDDLRWRSGGRELHRLASPCALRFVPGRTAAGEPPRGWRLSVSRASLPGPERELTIEGEVEWPSRGRVAMAVGGAGLRDVAEFIRAVPPGIEVRNGRLDVAWDSGVAVGEGEVEGRWEIPGELPVGVRSVFRGGTGGVHLEELRFDAGGGSVIEATGDIPVLFTPGSVDGWVRWNETEPFNLKLRLDPDETVRGWVERRLGVAVVEPRLEAEVTGLKSDPQVRLEGTVAKVGRGGAEEVEAVAVEDLKVKVEADRRQVRWREAEGSIEGQKVWLEGEVSWPAGSPTGWGAEDFLASLRGGRVRARVREVAVEPFDRHLPRFLAAQGRVDGDVEWRAGRLTGEVSVEGAATARLGFLAPVREIAARVVLEGTSARLDRCEGRVGGQPVQVSGGGGVGEDGGLRFDLVLRGTNLPLVRRRGMLLRTDLDLRVARTNEAAPVIGGQVRVHDSLLVEDLGLLVPGPAGPPEERPPYFQVRAAPYSGWRLGVHLTGERALRVYSPIFQGTVGPDLRLEGTLGEPVLEGEVRAESGRVLFPFGNLAIDHAAVRVTPSDPGLAMIEVRASALNYGYRIQMDVSGSTREPVVLFTSTPPLSSQEILLMLTAGSVPQGRMSYSTQDKVGRFGLILGRDFLTRLGFSDSSSERLEFRTGEYVSEQGRPTQQIEYRLSERWSAYGEYDRFGGINGGLKWRILSR